MRRELLFGNEELRDDGGRYKERINFNIFGDAQFKEYFRLSIHSVNIVLNNIGPIIEHNTTKNEAVDARQQLLLTLHWLGSGCQFHAVGAMHGISKSTICRTIHRVLGTIVNTMFQNTVCWPNNIYNLPEVFLRKGGFPSVCGCIDGTIINIDAPHENEEAYVDRHGNHSLNVMMICGPEYKFYCVNASWPGSVHDARVLRNSAIYGRFENGWRPFPNAVILGDSAYGIKEWLMPPIRRNPDDPTEQRFNSAHKRTRRIIENSFGILKERFPCLNHLRLSPHRAGIVVIACATLHNLCCDEAHENVRIEDLGNVDPEDEHDEENGHPPNGNAVNRLNAFLNYFRH